MVNDGLRTVVHTLKSLRVPNLGHNCYGWLGVAGFAPSLPLARNMEELDMSYNNLHDEGANSLFQALTHSSIKKLSIRKCLIFIPGSIMFAPLLPKTNLEILEMGSNAVQDE
jgi:Leucine Rich repeat